jgi:hypothetical protein
LAPGQAAQRTGRDRELVGAGDGGQLQGAGPVHHRAVRQLRGRPDRREVERIQQPGVKISVSAPKVSGI